MIYLQVIQNDKCAGFVNAKGSFICECDYEQEPKFVFDMTFEEFKYKMRLTDGEYTGFFVDENDQSDAWVTLTGTEIGDIRVFRKDDGRDIVFLSQHDFVLERYINDDMTFSGIDFIARRNQNGTFELISEGLFYQDDNIYYFIDYPLDIKEQDPDGWGDVNIMKGSTVSRFNNTGTLLYKTAPVTEQLFWAGVRIVDNGINTTYVSLYKTERNEHIITLQDEDDFMGVSRMYMLNDGQNDTVKALSDIFANDVSKLSCYCYMKDHTATFVLFNDEKLQKMNDEGKLTDVQYTDVTSDNMPTNCSYYKGQYSTKVKIELLAAINKEKT